MNADQPATAPDPAKDSTAQVTDPITPMAHPAMIIETTGQEPAIGGGDITPPAPAPIPDPTPAPVVIPPPAPAPDLSTLTRAQLEARVKTLSDSLASATTEDEYFRQKWQDLKLEDEALGKEALTADQKKIDEKLVAAVAELYRSEMKRREALILLDKLLETGGQILLATSNLDPKVRNDYEVATRATREYLAGHSGTAIPVGTTLADGRISDIDPDLNAVILNLGKTQGVKEGMPFVIIQDKQEVGMVKIVLARDLVSAALVQSLKPNTVLKVGDRVAVVSEGAMNALDDGR